MPMTYEIDEAAGIVTLTMTGTVTRDDMIGYFGALAVDPRFRDTMGRLVFADGATAYPPSSEVAELVDRMRRRTAANPPRYAVVASSPLAIGMANMFMGQSGLGSRYEIFSDPEAARTWLLRSGGAS